MSTNLVTPESAIQFVLEFSLILSSIVIFFYDYLLSLSDEIQLMWNGNFRLATILYVVIRYFPIFDPTYHIISVYFPHPSNCERVALLDIVTAMSIAARTAIIVFMIFQTYALWNRSIYVLVSLGILGVASVVADIFQAAIDPCSKNLSDKFQVIIKIFPVIQTVFSIIVMALTTYKITEMARVQETNLWKYMMDAQDEFTLTRIVFGHSLRMIGLCMIQIVGVLIIFIFPQGIQEVASPFILPLDCIIVSQQLLNLRKTERDIHRITGKLMTISPV